jgi:glycosyltransferase involved in cell wall biosynthesis
LVSIILPVFNGEKYIKTAIDGVLSQTYKNIELIVVDDGSTDSTKSIISGYLLSNGLDDNDDENDDISNEISKKIDNNINGVKYFFQENRGPGAARNYGISKSKGEFVAFIDADDVYSKDKIEKQVDYLQKNRHVSIVFNDIYIIDKNGIIGDIIKPDAMYENRRDFHAHYLFRQNIPCLPSVMIKRECFDYSGYSEKYRNSEDFYMLLKLSEKYEFGYLDEPLYYYRRHEDNLTNQHERHLENEIEIVASYGIEYLRRAVDESTLSPEEKDMLFIKILMKIREYEAAKEYLLGSVASVPSDVYKYFYLGNLFYLTGDYVNATDAYRKAQAADDSKAEVYNNLGCALYMLGDVIQAELNYKMAISINAIYNDPEKNLENFYKENVAPKLTERELRKHLMNYK